MDHPAVFGIVRELCGAHVRLDHAYGIVMAPGTVGLGLHGGGTPFDPAQYYVVRGGAIHTGLIAVQWSLVDHPPGCGGFRCVPGSHKAGFEPPVDIEDMAVDVPLAAGDVVVFTEALRHGTSPWRGPHERRTLLYKYSPGSSSWASQHTWPDELVAACTERQRLLLQPPSVAYHRPVV
jgi:ectoine hydroxylase-related dioxygenase (phytanoyl-CoA dioxygenase family)